MRQDNTAPQDTLSLKIRGTKAIVSPFDIHVLGYPVDYTLHNFIVEDILTFNCVRNLRYRNNPPAIFIVGIDQIKASLTSRLFDILPLGSTIASVSIIPEVLMETIYQEILHRDPACVILVGFHNISFNKESPSETIDAISELLSDIRKINNQFRKPILITTRIHPRRADLDICIPQLEVNGSEFEITTDRHENIQAPFGYFKFFHIPRENPNPVKLFHGKSGPVTRKR